MDTFPLRNVIVSVAVATAPSLVGCLAPPLRAQGRVEDAPEASKPKAEAETGPELARRLASLVEAHNRERKMADLSPLKVSPKLQATAESHALDMAEHRKMSHKGSDGSTPFQRMEKQGYRFRRAGENVAYGQSDVEGVMKVWMN